MNYWALHISYSTYAMDLRARFNGKRYCLPFAACVVCWHVKDRVSDCYVCLTGISEHTSKNKLSIEYPYLPPALRLVPHVKELHVPEELELRNLENDAKWSRMTKQRS
jgi:hypothetical protein